MKTEITLGQTVLFFNEINYGLENLQEFEVEIIAKTKNGIVVSGLSNGIYYDSEPIENFFTSIDEFVMVKAKELSSYLKRNKTMNNQAICDLFGVPTGNGCMVNQKRYLA